MSFDDELRRTLKREDPGERFAERVLARIHSGTHPHSLTTSGAARLWPGLAAAALLLATGSGLYYSHQQSVRIQAAEARAERLRIEREAERARNDAVLGLRIASAKLNDVQMKLERFAARDRNN